MRQYQNTFLNFNNYWLWINTTMSGHILFVVSMPFHHTKTNSSSEALKVVKACNFVLQTRFHHNFLPKNSNFVKGRELDRNSERKRHRVPWRQIEASISGAMKTGYSCSFPENWQVYKELDNGLANWCLSNVSKLAIPLIQVSGTFPYSKIHNKILMST